MLDVFNVFKTHTHSGALIFIIFANFLLLKGSNRTVPDRAVPSATGTAVAADSARETPPHSAAALPGRQ